MSRIVYRVIPALAALVVGAVWISACARGQPGGSSEESAAGMPSTARGDWTHYTADVQGSKYSPLDQISGSNFNELELAWSFRTDNLGTRPEYKLEGTPLAINGILYTTAGTRRSIIALDGRSGELLWVHRYPEGARGAAAPRQLSGRGVSYWTDGQGDERILYVTPGYRLVALDARTGAMIPTFGESGIVDLKVGAVYGTGTQIDLETGEIGLHSTPTVVQDIVLVGSAFKEGFTVATSNNTKGMVRAFDVRTGRLIWTFNTIPRPGEFGNDTWLSESWSNNGNTGVWTQMTVDEANGIAYLPVESPTSDFYGGARPGDNLFGESLVAVDLRTGERKWHFQFVHHAIWDHDMSSAPLIADVTIAGQPRQVVAVPSKQAWLYVFDRITGEPIWPIEEKAMPAGDVPGEWYPPTQPYPPAALMYGRNALNSVDDLIDFTPEMRAQAIRNLERYKWFPGVVYNPPIVGDVNGILGAINLGNASGGTNWPGGGYDPETGIVYVQAGTSAIGGTSVAPPPEGFSDIAYQVGAIGRPFRVAEAAGTNTYADVPDQPRARPAAAAGGGAPEAAGAAAAAGGARAGAGGAPAAAGGAPAGRGGRGGGGGGEGGGLNVQGLPILTPPYGVLAAIDLKVGNIKWRVPHGDTPDAVRNHPALRGRNIPKTGQGGSVGLLVTKTLVVLGDPQVTTTDEHPRGAMLRAYNKDTGAEVGAVYMPAPQSGSPLTYLGSDGKQYIVVAVSGGPYSGEYRAYALPN